ncbi:MAG: hypothetical protein AB8G14_09230 [Ilumatobacter sp.]
MPDVTDVQEFLSDLLGKTIDVEPSEPLDLNDEEMVTLCGLFVEPSGDLGGLCVADLSWASYSGAGLAMIPAPMAEESIAAGVLADDLRENYYEVANILTGLLNGPSVAHLKLTELVDGVPSDARDLIIKAAGRRSFRCSLPGYGEGALALYAR